MKLKHRSMKLSRRLLREQLRDHPLKMGFKVCIYITQSDMFNVPNLNKMLTSSLHFPSILPPREHFALLHSH